MKIDYHRRFRKAFERLPKKVQKKFFARLNFFIEDQFHPSLNNHALHGKSVGTRSFDVTGDVRVHYEEITDGVVLMDIGTHSQLYS